MPVPKKKRSKAKAAKRLHFSWLAPAHKKAAVALQLAKVALKRANANEAADSDKTVES